MNQRGLPRRVTLNEIVASAARAACGVESLLRHEVRYEPDARGTTGRAKMLAFLRVNVARAQATPLQRLDDREQLRDGRGEGCSSFGSGKGLLQRGKMQPT